MDVTVYSYPPGDPVLIEKIVNEFLSQGKFDKLRKECMADADTKPAYQNLQQRVESTVTQFLKKQVWKPDLNKNQLRDSLRKHILESGFLDAGINRIVDQIVNPSVLATVFMPEVEEVVYSYLSIPRPGDKYPKHADSSNKLLENAHSKQSEMTRLDLDKDDNIHRMEGTSPVSDDFRLSDSDLSGGKTPDTSPPRVPGVEVEVENEPKEVENEIKHEEDNIVTDQFDNCSTKEEKPDVTAQGGVNCNIKVVADKMEAPSDESQESLSKMGVERLRISESDGVNAPDSDASLPLEINEKSTSGSRDSDDFIINKMSPISQGRLTPEEVTLTVEDEKKPLTFVGRIPKIKRDDSESSKSCKKEEKIERSVVKGICSSDESDSSKQSVAKSDSEDKKVKEEKPKIDEPREKSDKKDKECDDKRRKSDHHRGHSRDRKSRDDKSRSNREKDKSHSRPRDDKSREKERKSSSHSRSKSSSHHKSMHRHDRGHHRDESKSRDRDRNRHDRRERDRRDADRRKREDEKRKKSKSVDDHGKERYRRDDRRSTDRDSNERDRAKDTSSSRIQSNGKRREKEQKADDSKKGRNPKEENSEKEGSMKEATEAPRAEHTNEQVVCEEAVIEPPVANEVVAPVEVPSISEEVKTENCLDVKALAAKGALTVVKFPKVADDYYVKFQSTGFKYFEEWETTKLDCEEEFKDFIDEAGKDLSLISDEGSDCESYYDHKIFEAQRQEIVSNSLRGFTNFADGLIFDPGTSEFYKWTNHELYEKYVTKKETLGETERCPGSVKMMDEYETAEKNKENRSRDKKVRKSLKLLNRYQRKIGLKLKYGKEQHRFVRRRKKRYWSADAKGFKMREWYNGNPGGSEDCRESVIKNDSKYLETPRVLLLNPPAEDVLKECQDLANYVESSGCDTSVDDLAYDDGKNGETSSGKCTIDESSNNSSASAPKMDVEAKIRLYQIQSMRRNKAGSRPQKTCILARISSGSKTDAEYEEVSDNVNNCDMATSHLTNLTKKIKKRRIRIGLSRARLKRDVDMAVRNIDVHKDYNLPLSPESEDSTSNNNGGITQKNPRKRPGDEYSVAVPMEIPVKKTKEKRIIQQKYDSQDLYKPRPFSIGSKSRGRAVRPEENNFSKIETKEK